MVTVDEATRIMRAHMAPVAAEPTPLLGALGRVVASPVVATIPLPPFDTAGRDGFAVRAGDLAGPLGNAVSLPIGGAIFVGARHVPPLAPGSAVPIMAGAPLPDGADAVVPLDAAGAPDARVSLPAGVLPGAHVRRAGEDVARGARVLETGDLLNASRIALLAALGRETALVFAPLRVAVLTTGDELAEPGGPLAPGQTYDSNAYALMAAIAEAGGQPIRVRATGDADDIRRGLARALGGDVVITTGGVGPGDHDHVVDALTGLGRVHFTRVAQEPGSAFTFAVVRGKPVFGLPGDPVAAAICFEVHVRPALRRMMGRAALERPRVLAIASEAYQRRPGRQAFLGAKVRKAGAAYHVRLAGATGPGMLGTLAAANALVMLPAESRGFEAGDLVETMLLEAPELCGMACLPVGAPGDAPIAAPFAIGR